jgi:hypothetical protein
VTENVRVLGKLAVKGELLSRTLCGVVDLLAPDGERAEDLGVGVVVPPSVFDRF